MRVPKIVASLMVGVGLLVSQQPAEAKGETSLQTYIGQMARQGWVELRPGVLQRTTGSGTVERFAYGEAGMAFTIEEAVNLLGTFLRAYEANPTKEGAQAVEAQADEVKRLRRELAEMQATDSLGNLEAFLSNGCSFSWSYNADAAYLTSSQGVTATASANFTNDCGYWADLYSYALAQGMVGNTYTTSYQQDPFTGGTISGTTVSTFATRTLAATSQCHSSAQSTVTVTALGVALSASDTNDQCPVPLPTVTITGLALVLRSGFTCTTITWTANGSGGTPGYTYAWTWNGTPVGTGGSTYSRSLCGTNTNSSISHTLGVTLTDSASQTATATKTVTVHSIPASNCPTGIRCLPSLEPAD